jgi:hypothetical protein
MNYVSLVSTVHGELGLANVLELHAILERIRPEVIFLEVPPASLDDYYVICSRSNLESIAVRKYRESHQVKLVPVDCPTPAAEFFESIEYLHARIRAESSEYRQLMSRDTASIRALGFAYLNSEQCSNLWSDAYKEMLSAIRRIDEPRLVEIFESWKSTNRLRVKEMMKTIQEFCRSNTFHKSAFLLGAAHRRPIIDESREQSSVDSNKLQWDFSIR